MTNTASIFNIQKYSIHDGPGIRTVVFFKGCPLKCYWCANPESQDSKPEKMWDNQKKTHTTVGNYRTADEIMEDILKDEVFYQESNGGVTLSGGEVLYQADFAIDLLKRLREKNIHTACETTGYVKSSKFEEFLENVDLVYMDIKHYDSIKHFDGTGVRNELILKNLALALAKHPHLIVRIPIIPNFNDTLEDAVKFADLFNEYGVEKIELLPFHQFGEKKYTYLDRDYEMEDIPQLHSEDLLDYQTVMEKNGIQCLVH
ncbi:glycyl-radical enzyme activating protein [Lacticigenium naphthae]|uniref:glycyl-radical enzyme activating protein n=1 Tax=Lacticigenium naphthae TaxID=515351 RepID=UPI0003F73282|nr:glycyl-radical enzyme activating protein [Lacticigenium naphthae]